MEIAEIGATGHGYRHRHRHRHRDLLPAMEHDAIYVVRKLPTVMLFCPCHGGLSHNAPESITPGWAEAGILVLAGAVLTAAGGPTGSEAG